MQALLAALSIEQAAMPGVLLLLGIIKAHVNATHGTFPTEAEILAAVPADVQALKDIWAAWSATHPDPKS
jgi:hypothetical protein